MRSKIAKKILDETPKELRDKVNRYVDMAVIRKELGISNSWIAETYGYADVSSYNKSAGKKRIENLIVELYKKMKP